MLAEYVHRRFPIAPCYPDNSNGASETIDSYHGARIKWLFCAVDSQSSDSAAPSRGARQATESLMEWCYSWATRLTANDGKVLGLHADYH